MIIVTGTKRAGTSLWMQMLKAAGFEIIGSPFPGVWGESIREANPDGFYENKFRNGIFYATNPDPETGAFISPGRSKKVGIKVFIPGLVRTDLAYIHRVVATIRHWRDYGPSLNRLRELEDTYHLRTKGEEAVQARLERRKRLKPAHVEWFLEYYELIRDVSVQRYPLRIVAHERLCEEPNRVLKPLFNWFEQGDVAAATALVRSGRVAIPTGPIPEGISDTEAQVFEELWLTYYEERPLSAPFLEKLDETQLALIKRFGPLSRERSVDDGG